jgi:hypothetical protein
MISGGLIPRKEKYENTFVVGYEGPDNRFCLQFHVRLFPMIELEMLIECKDQETFDEWLPAVRNRVKHCLLAKKEFGGKFLPFLVFFLSSFCPIILF